MEENKNQFSWKFTNDSNAAFIAENALYNSRLYFPLFNRAGMKCSVTPELKGDICKSLHAYHSIPLVTEDLHHIVNGRYFWVKTKGARPWCAAGVSATEKAAKWTDNNHIQTQIEGRIGAFKTVKTNKNAGLEATTTMFVPFHDDFVEISIIEIKNIGDKALTFSATSACPVYGRSADNLRDHRNVTTMFNRNKITENGVSVKPLITFNEFGHSNNSTTYYSLGYSDNGKSPEDIWCTMKDFVGEGGSMDNPEAVFSNKPAPKQNDLERNGYEAVGAFRFQEETIKPGDKKCYILINGISDDEKITAQWKNKYGDINKAEDALQKTLNQWDELVNRVSFKTADQQFGNWMQWVNLQLFCRQVYGNSYLPDFGYGRGGRGWRDLWSDLLSIFLVDPQNALNEIINNFKGVRIDGTNATIIGTEPGEFIADRNNVPRTWCDHGVWPVFVLNFYIQQTGNFNILWEEVTYWKDVFSHRTKGRDKYWDETYGHYQKTKKDKIYAGTIFEHVLLQQLASFFNVGEHNIMLLEGADWNDTYDMARNNGESVCFNNWVAGNLKTLVRLLEDVKDEITHVELLSEISILLDTCYSDKTCNYNSVDYKKNVLKQYHQAIQHNVSGEKQKIEIEQLINDLKAKAEFLYTHIRSQEWITVADGNSFYNGHYGDFKNRVHGDHPNGVRIDLTSQVMPTIFDVATNEQIPLLHKSIMKFLHNSKAGGLHLCSNFKEDELYFGRLTGFSYGHKEHGGIWMQQNVMYMYGLYKRNFVNEAYQVFNDIYKLCNTPEIAKTFPCIPSYFEPDGHGAYTYLTGSATWLTLTLVTQMFGVRGEKGNLCLNPKLTKQQFGNENTISLLCNFQDIKLLVTYYNPGKAEWNQYAIKSTEINGEPIQPETLIQNKAVIAKDTLHKICKKDTLNKIQVTLRG